MPQLHLPMFPAGVTPITDELAFERRDGKIAYFNGQIAVFVHAEDDVATFRMITSQFCANGHAQAMRHHPGFRGHLDQRQAGGQALSGTGRERLLCAAGLARSRGFDGRRGG